MSKNKCEVCGRGYSHDHSEGDGICQECFELAGMDNTVNDDGRTATPEELREAIGYLDTIARRGGDTAKVIGSNGYLFGEGFEYTAPAARKVGEQGEKARPHRGQKAMIRRLLAKKVSVATIVTRVNEKVGGKCTPGYVRWVAKSRGVRMAVAA